MFEIGNTLREARLRRGLDILDCEAETKIRAKYLRAMEEEEFDVLPSPTYVRGFLRTYAEFLDLDGQLVLDEYESRFLTFDEPEGEGRRARRAHAPPDAPPGAGRPRSRPRRARRRRSEVQLLWLAIGGVMSVALLIWLGVGESGEPEPALQNAPATATTGPVTASDPDTPADEGPVQPRRTTIRISGVGAIGSYLEVRARNSTGRTVYEGTLVPGQSLRFRVTRSIWIAVGNTDGLEVLVNGDPQEVTGGTANFVVSRTGVIPG